MAFADEITIRPARRVAGVVRVPGDKSISHRALILAALADGQSEIANLAPGDDGRATIGVLSRLGVRLTRLEPSDNSAPSLWRVDGVGVSGLHAPEVDLDALNSGTTARMMMGVLAGCAFETTLSGDTSLQRRPMRRVVEPLERMGAVIRTTDGRLPARIDGRPLTGIDYTLPVASAQVKSAILLAGLSASGVTTVREPSATRDHTELALRAFGIQLKCSNGAIELRGGQRLSPTRVDVPGDPSSAAFWAAAAAALPDSSIEIQDVGLNPTRTAFLGILAKFGARVESATAPAAGSEPRGSVRVAHGGVGAVSIGREEVPALIDEIPVLAALAAHGGSLRVTGAEELRVKESDRITSLARGFRAMGGKIDEQADGFYLDGSSPLTGGTVDAAGDHRLAMAFAIAALGAKNETVIRGARVVSVSYPGFFDVLAGLCR